MAGRSAPLAGTPGDDNAADIAGSLRFLLRPLLGVSMAAVAVAVLVGSHLHVFSESAQRTAVPPHLQVQPTTSPLPVPSSEGTAPSVPLRPIVYTLFVIALLAALVLSIWWARRLSRVVALPPALPDAGSSRELREAVASGQAAMQALDDARAAIIACYEAMEQSLAARGAARGVAGTPDDLLRHATDQKVITGTGGRRLTTLFYEARFSTHDLPPGTRSAAIRALDDLAAELGGTEPDEVPAEGTSERA